MFESLALSRTDASGHHFKSKQKKKRAYEDNGTLLEIFINENCINQPQHFTLGKTMSECRLRYQMMYASVDIIIPSVSRRTPEIFLIFR